MRKVSSVDKAALLRVRLLHPGVATIAACYVLWVIWRSLTGRNRLSRSAITLVILLFVQIEIGMTNVLFLAPVWVQIAHLFVADALWILLVLASANLVLESAVTCPAYVLASVVEEGQKA